MHTLFAAIDEVIALATGWLIAQITVISRTISAPNLIQRAALIAHIVRVGTLALVAFMFIAFIIAKALHNLDDIS
jgi:hypothetical protein